MTSDLRSRYLSDRVLTATPAQRVVMLYDRLHVDLTRAAKAGDSADGTTDPNPAHLDHALQVVAELAGSLDMSAGGPAENLSSLYGYLIGELVAVRGGQTGRLAGARHIVETLREAWSAAVASMPGAAAPSAPHSAVQTATASTAPAAAGRSRATTPAHEGTAPTRALAPAATGGSWVG